MRHAIAVRTMFVLALVVTVLPGELLGQGGPLQPGDRLRINAPRIGGAVVATLVRLRGDTLIVSSATDSALALPLTSIERLQISRGRSRLAGARRGAVIGLATGAAIGTAFTILVATDNGGDGNYGLIAALIGVAETGIVTVLGAGIGALVGREHWETVAIMRLPSALTLPSAHCEAGGWAAQNELEHHPRDCERQHGGPQ